MTIDTYHNLLLEISLAQLDLEYAILRRQTVGGYLLRLFRDDEIETHRRRLADLRQRVAVLGRVESSSVDKPALDPPVYGAPTETGQ